MSGDHQQFFSVIEQKLEPFSGNLAPQLVDIELMKMDKDRTSFNRSEDESPLFSNLAIALTLIIGPDMSAKIIKNIRDSVKNV